MPLQHKKKPSYVSFNITASLSADLFYSSLLPIIEELSNLRRERGSSLQINAPILAISGKTSNDSLHPVIRDLTNVGVDNVRLSFPWAPQEAGEVQMYGFLPRQDYTRAVDVFQQLESSFKPVSVRAPQIRPFDHCFVMAQALSISPEGDVYPCPEVCAPHFKHKYSYGSILTHKISDLWAGENHRETFTKLDPRSEKCICCQVDGDFNNLCATYWPPEFGRRK